MKRGKLLFVRLKKRADFLRVARIGMRHVSPGLILLSAPQDMTNVDPSRPTIGIGFTASKKVGNAVTRNRVKRRLRAAVREVIHHNATPNRDYVVIGRGKTVDRPFENLKSDLIKGICQTNGHVKQSREAFT